MSSNFLESNYFNIKKRYHLYFFKSNRFISVIQITFEPMCVVFFLSFDCFFNKKLVKLIGLYQDNFHMI